VENKLVDGVSTIENLIGENFNMKNLEEFKAHEFAGQFKAEIEESMKVENDEKIQEAKKEALAEERKRIADIQALSMPGYEKVISEGIEKDLSASDVSMNIIKAQKEEIAQKKDSFDNDNPGVLPEIEPVEPVATEGNGKGFLDLVRDYAKEKSCTIAEARAAVIQENPEAFEKFRNKGE
jgi:hypothetical protein